MRSSLSRQKANEGRGEGEGWGSKTLINRGMVLTGGGQQCKLCIGNWGEREGNTTKREKRRENNKILKEVKGIFCFRSGEGYELLGKIPREFFKCTNMFERLIQTMEGVGGNNEKFKKYARETSEGGHYLWDMHADN